MIAGQECPSVICQRHGPAFAYQDQINPECWHIVDALPKNIVDALPACERDRCERHKARRMGGTT